MLFRILLINMSRLAASSQSAHNFDKIFLNLHIDVFEQQKNVDDISDTKKIQCKNCTRKFLNCVKLD